MSMPYSRIELLSLNSSKIVECLKLTGFQNHTEFLSLSPISASYQLGDVQQHTQALLPKVGK